jgi:hypothetical protein
VNLNYIAIRQARLSSTSVGEQVRVTIEIVKSFCNSCKSIDTLAMSALRLAFRRKCSVRCVLRKAAYNFTTPMPGRSINVTFPSIIFVPSKTSFLMSNAPSRSAQSTIGERCEAADIAHEVSVIQPIITFIPSERASVSISY